MIKVIMFDLDGTLLPMDQEIFIKTYFEALATKITPLGYDINEVLKAIKTGVKSMVKNDGSDTNEHVFWAKFSELMGENIKNYKEVFDDFYENEFQKIKKVCGTSIFAKEVVMIAKEKGFRVVLATSPLYPKFATESRIRWAGLEPNDFEQFTTYEDYSYAKPNLEYYKELMKKLGVYPNECVMIGNDVEEDMVAKELGIDVFLLTECLINKKKKEIVGYRQGGFAQLIEFIKEL